MLHSLTLALGVIALVGGLVSLAIGIFPPAFVFLSWGILIVAGTVFERYRYKPIAAAAPHGRWVKTTERFIDEQTGKPVTVYLDPESGERQYVNE
ncbi:MAG TPA: hypothetical protein VIJ85_01220 [Rhizomicrobium sp.]